MSTNISPCYDFAMLSSHTMNWIDIKFTVPIVTMHIELTCTTYSLTDNCHLLLQTFLHHLHRLCFYTAYNTALLLSLITITICPALYINLSVGLVFSKSGHNSYITICKRPCTTFVILHFYDRQWEAHWIGKKKTIYPHDLYCSFVRGTKNLMSGALRLTKEANENKRRRMQIH